MREHPSNLTAKQPTGNAIDALPKVYSRKRKKSIDEHNSTTPAAKYTFTFKRNIFLFYTSTHVVNTIFYRSVPHQSLVEYSPWQKTA